MSFFEAADAVRLHGRDIGPGGVPRLTEKFVCYLDRRRPHPDAIPLAAAWTRLQAEYPLWAVAVEHTVIHNRTVRKAAPHIGCCFKMVALRKNAGVAQIAVWTDLPEHVVVDQVARLPGQGAIASCPSP